MKISFDKTYRVWFYIIKHVRPSFKSDALEDGEHGQSKIVEIRDTVVGTLPELFAAMILGSEDRALVAHLAARYRLVHYLACDAKENRFFNLDGINGGAVIRSAAVYKRAALKTSN